MLRQETDGKASQAGRGSRWVLGLAAVCALSAGLSHLAADDTKPAGARRDARETPRTDLHGDQLPPGALARLGTLRWRHGTPVAYLAFTADGKAVLTASQDNVIRLWDRGTGKEIRRFGKKSAANAPAGGDPQVQLRLALLQLRGGGANGGGVALAPDGKTLAAVQGNAIQLWEVATGKEIRAIPAPPSGAGTLLFSADGKLLAGRGGDQTTRLWETNTGKEIRQFRKPQNNPRAGVVFIGGGSAGGPPLALSPDGKLVATSEVLLADGKRSRVVILWDVETGKEARQIEVNPQGIVSILAFSPDGKVLACAGANAIHLFAPETGKEIRRAAEAQGRVAALAFAPDGKTLAVKSLRDGLVRLCSVESGKVVRELGDPEGGPRLNNGGFRGTTGVERNLAFSPDGKVVAVAFANTVRFWAADTGKEVAEVSGHRSEVTALAIAPGGKLVASRGADNTVRLWEAATGKERHQFRAPAGTIAAVFAPDARTVALANIDNTVRLHEVATGKELHRLQGHKNGVAAFAFSPDGKVVASRGSADNTIRLFDVGTGKEGQVIALLGPKSLPNAGGGAVLILGGRGRPSGGGPGLAFAPDGKTVATLAGGGRVGGPGLQPALSLYDVATGKEVGRIALPAQYGVVSFAFAPDGRTLATENTDQTITLWEIASGRERTRLGTPAVAGQPGMQMQILVNGGGFGSYARTAVSATLVFAPDGRTLAVRGPERSVRVWDVAAGKEIGALKGHEGAVTALAFARDGKTLASGSSDTTTLVWDATRLRPAPRPQQAQLPAADVDTLWGELTGADAAKAFAGMQRLAADPAQVVPFLRGRLRPVEAVEAAKLRQLVADLDNNRFVVRERATRELEKLGELALPALTAALNAGPPLETRKRLEQLLNKATGAILTGDQLRLVRAVEVLEEIATPEARQILETLRGGASGALPTRHARAALDRLAR